MKGATIGAWVFTVIWFLIIGSVVYFKWADFASMPPNEWGDFLAGSVSPLAFIWLVAGYLQQGKELKLNTDALRGQHEVMRLQREEMAAQVELYKQMVEQATEQARATSSMAAQAEIESMMTVFKPGYK